MIIVYLFKYYKLQHQYFFFSFMNILISDSKLLNPIGIIIEACLPAHVAA